MKSTKGKSSGRAPSRRNFLMGAVGTMAVAAGTTAHAENESVSDAALVLFGEELAAVDRQIGKIEDRFAFIHQQVRDECPVPALIKSLAENADEQALRNGQAPVSARFLALRAESELRRSATAFDAGVPAAAKTDIIKTFKTEVDGAYERLGYGQLEALHRDLSTLESDLVDKIYATPAEGVTGLVVKLRVIDRMELWTEAKPEDDFHRAFLGDTLRNAERLAKAKPSSAS
jgi:hypothetical protein